MDLYEKWYEVADENPPFTDKHFAGYVERRPTHLRKLMILSSVARSDNLIVEPFDFHRASLILSDLEKPMTRAFGALGLSELAPVQEEIRRYFLEKKEVLRSEIFAHFWRDADGDKLDKILRALKEAKFITFKVDPKKGETIYVLNASGNLEEV